MARVRGCRSKQDRGLRRLSGACCALCAALLLTTSGCVAPRTAGEIVFHEDPSTVRETYKAWVLFAHLGGALRLVASEDFGSAVQQLAAVEVWRAHLPSGLVDLAGRYTDLCNELSTTIENLYDSLDQAELMLAANDLRRAGLALDTCSPLLTRANELLEALQDATQEVLSMLRRSGSGTTSTQLDAAREALDDALARLMQLTATYEARLADIGAQAEIKQGLVEPALTLALDRDAAWVGETAGISGALSAGSSPLVGRRVSVLMDGAEVADVESDGRGLFRLGVQIPFEYLPRREFQAAFRPEGGDLARFQPATSPASVLTVRFNQSVATIEPLLTLYPGLPATLVGVVESTGSLEGRPVAVAWGSEPVGDAAVGAGGAVECTVLLPDDAPAGDGTLRVAVAGDDEAATAPCVSDVDVDVARLAPHLELSVDRLLFVPALSASLPRQLLGGDFVRAVPVSGEVSSPLPLGEVLLSAGWGGTEVNWEQGEAEFLHDVPLHMSIWSTGLRTVTLRASPREPWHTPSEAHATLFVVNLFMPLIWLVAVLVALVLGAAVRRWWRAFAGADVPPLQVAPVLAHSLAPLPASVPATVGRGGPRSVVVNLYYRAVGFMQSTLGVVLRREMTLREYLGAVSARIPAALQAFSGLTALAERALYGRHEPDPRDVEAGRTMLETMSPETRDDEADGEEEGR